MCCGVGLALSLLQDVSFLWTVFVSFEACWGEGGRGIVFYDVWMGGICPRRAAGLQAGCKNNPRPGQGGGACKGGKKNFPLGVFFAVRLAPRVDHIAEVCCVVACCGVPLLKFCGGKAAV